MTQISRIAGIALAAAIFMHDDISAPAQEFRLIDSIPGQTVAIVAAALPEFERRNLDLNYFTIHVTEDDGYFFVSFVGNGFPTDLPAQTRYTSGLEVKLNKVDLFIIDAYLVE